MIAALERAGDRLLGLVVRHVSAAADPCSCSGSGCRPSACFCDGASRILWAKVVCCNGCHWETVAGCGPTNSFC
jgi:hypothetical protein